MESVEIFLEILTQYRGGRILVLCHDDADNDALGAAYAVVGLVDGVLAVPARVSEHARELKRKLNINIIYGPNPDEFDLTILVDTADAQQLPDCVPREYLLIDHHRDNKLVDGARASIYKTVDSTCQLVWELFQALDRRPDSNTALALAAGIMGDTRYLATAANATIIQLAEIMEAGGVTYGDLLKLQRVTSRIDREVRLQAALSADLYQVGDCLVVVNSVERNYVYYVAMMLLELGADIALVGYQQGADCYVRLAKSPATAHCLNLYTVLSGAVTGMKTHNLWGNADFAGFNGQAEVGAVAKAVIAQLKKVQENLGLCQCSEHTNS
ncbi:MAG: hypothetical protein FH749_01160 [Firmicutes bacterium]|nr:hypothetical protein [Bacillota bacterium]